MQPEIHLGPLTLQTFGICFALGFVASGAVLARRLKEVGKPPDWSYEVVFSALLGGLVGSRLDYLIQNYDKVSGDLLGSVFSGSGLVWFGGLIGGAAGVLIWAWRRGYLGLELLDVAAVPLALGYAIGRVGCQVSGDGDYGTKTDAFWGMSYPNGTVPTNDTVHPTPVFESVAMGLVALLLWRWRDRFATGQLFALYLVLSGLERLGIEFLRRNEHVAVGLTLPQLFSLGLIAAGAAMIVRAGGLRPKTA